MKLLIGMMSYGENERERAIEALKQQSFRDWEFFEVRDKPNKEAHQELYRTFMASGAECCLKLDADMVLKADILEYLVKQSRETDITMVAVDDWPSRLNIPGMQAFSNRCRWEDDGDRLNVDTAPIADKMAYVHGKPWVDHMPDPGEFQSFRYGVHKALKLMQPDRTVKSPVKAELHGKVLQNIWRHRKEDRRRELMILGAECVFSGQHRDLLDAYAGAASSRLFEACRNEDVSKYAVHWDGSGVSRLAKLLGEVWTDRGPQPAGRPTNREKP